MLETAASSSQLTASYMQKSGRSIMQGAAIEHPAANELAARRLQGAQQPGIIWDRRLEQTKQGTHPSREVCVARAAQAGETLAGRDLTSVSAAERFVGVQLAMSLTRADVVKIAHLARLAISEDDIPVYLRELSRILDFVAAMNTVDTNNIDPMAHPLDATQRLRPDQVTEDNRRTQFQALAPLVEDGLYLVPKVIE